MIALLIIVAMHGSVCQLTLASSLTTPLQNETVVTLGTEEVVFQIPAHQILQIDLSALLDEINEMTSIVQAVQTSKGTYQGTPLTNPDLIKETQRLVKGMTGLKFPSEHGREQVTSHVRRQILPLIKLVRSNSKEEGENRLDNQLAQRTSMDLPEVWEDHHTFTEQLPIDTDEYQRAKSVLRDTIQNEEMMATIEDSILRSLLTSMAQGQARSMKVAADMIEGIPSWYPKTWTSIERLLDRLKYSVHSPLPQMMPTTSSIMRYQQTSYLNIEEGRITIGAIHVVPVPHDYCQIRRLARLPVIKETTAMELGDAAVCSNPTGVYEVPKQSDCMKMDNRWYCHRMFQRPSNDCLATILQRNRIPEWCKLRMSNQRLYHEVIDKDRLLIAVSEATILQPKCWTQEIQAQILYPGTYMINMDNCNHLTLDNYDLKPNPYAKRSRVHVAYLTGTNSIMGLQELPPGNQEPGETITQLKLSSLQELITEQQQLVWFSAITSGLVISICLVCLVQKCCMCTGTRLLARCLNSDPSTITNPTPPVEQSEGIQERRTRDSARQRRERQTVALRALPAPRTNV